MAGREAAGEAGVGPVSQEVCSSCISHRVTGGDRDRSMMSRQWSAIVIRVMIAVLVVTTFTSPPIQESRYSIDEL